MTIPLALYLIGWLLAHRWVCRHLPYPSMEE